MIIFLRQNSISIGSSSDHELTLAEAGFIWVRYVEVFDDRIEFMPLEQDQDHMVIEKVNDDCWLEPNTGIIYEYLFIYPSERIRLLPQHLEIRSAKTINQIVAN
jgi:hypothetical protein